MSPGSYASKPADRVQTMLSSLPCAISNLSDCKVCDKAMKIDFYCPECNCVLRVNHNGVTTSSVKVSIAIKPCQGCIDKAVKAELERRGIR